MSYVIYLRKYIAIHKNLSITYLSICLSNGTRIKTRGQLTCLVFPRQLALSLWFLRLGVSFVDI